ncbi:ribonuclease HII [Maribius pontilimi]|uniref:Ribonuclease HII n=1 Tax=Palleronia pontilimi TaxID=1964209 RepID=A0A934IER6_9RHOB|nr:ribonuclease HII [Palleronia pontilimi]MBJ3761396.1 ribonuclease HII [Palleronia pontilimi]
MPDFSFETAARARGATLIAGVDEVGRGPWAGPVIAAAVMLEPGAIPPGLNDSKKLTPKRRDALFDILQDCARIGVGQASVAEIDAVNILQASFLAMRRAVDALPIRPDHLLIDGNKIPSDLPCGSQAIVKGDGLSLSIAAASIIAKVTRDRIMVTLAQQHPHYGWDSNMGYGAPQHQVGLKSHGVTLHHRRSFKPIHNILYQEKSQ